MKKLLLRLLISLCLGAAMLYLAARQLPLAGVGQALREAEWLFMLPYLLAMALQHLFRAWRWCQLLAPIHPVPFSRVLPISSVGFLAIVALPLRMGELVRPYLIADPPRLRLTHALGTMAIERVFDGLVLALTAFLAVHLARRHTVVPGWIAASGLIAFGLFAAGLVVLVIALWQRDRAVALCRRVVGWISPRLAVHAAAIAQGIVDGLRVLPHGSRLAAFLGATVSYWFLNGLATWFTARAFDLQLALWPACAVTALIGVGIMIPGGPGFIGNFELFAKGALALYVQPARLARSSTAFILTAHTANVLWYAVAGIVGLLSPHVTFRKAWRTATHSEDFQVEQPQNREKMDSAPGTPDR